MGSKSQLWQSTRSGRAMIQIRVRSERRILRAEMSCAPAVAARNISAVVDVQFNQAAGVDKIQRTEQDINNIYSALRLYEARNYQMPDQDQGLEALVSMPTTGTKPANWLKLMDSVPSDPWNTPYQYRNPGKRDPSGIDVFSFGPDRKEGPNNIFRRVN